MLYLRIYGDNIVECERGLSLIADALQATNVKLNEEKSFPTNPEYTIISTDPELTASVCFFPGFGRWSNDIASIIENMGGILREATDIIITKLIDIGDQKQAEKILIGIEFCGALAAGNQAWQRCGRAYSFSKSGIPYIYLTDIGGFELDKNREEKAVRLPNPIVPFSFLSHTLYSGNSALPVFVPSFAITKKNNDLFEPCYGNEALSLLLKCVISEKSFREPIKTLFDKTSSFINFLSQKRKKADTFESKQWLSWISAIKNSENHVDFICTQIQPWKKTAYIEGLTKSAKKVIENTSSFAVGVGAAELPVCLIPKNKRKAFAHYIESVYPTLTQDFLLWLKQEKDLCMCWVMGFKPRGDDARPDRGVVPLARMLLGENIDLLTFVYGPAKPFTWPLLINNPQELYEKNGLWESILKLSDAVLIDSSTDQITKKGYTKNHWATKKKERKEQIFNPTTYPPLVYSENDIDTILHLIFNSNGQRFFECMCNPPGGDWSGISIKDVQKKAVLRWLSLPRVSARGDKRPDHVFQLFPPGQPPLFLAIESKEKKSTLKQENDIGKRLISYISTLLSSPASVLYQDNWTRNHDGHNIEINASQFVSGVAFFYDGIDSLKDTAIEADVVFSVQIEKGKATVFLYSKTKVGLYVANFIKANFLLNKLINITIINN